MSTVAVPTPPEERYASPTASVDPDTTKSWWRRMMPILRAHRVIILSGIGGAVLGMPLQLAIPRVVRYAIDDGLLAPEGDRAPLGPFLVVLGFLALGRFVLGFFFRYNLQRTSFVIEFDLRTAMYDHFSRLSFSYFDKVQTGQLISRANSDIRAVQMFLAFAPMMGISVLQFFAAFALMATVHLPLAVVALACMPGVYWAGTRMRELMFPASWIVSARQADVATIVEENVTGTRVVKAFAAEQSQLTVLEQAAERLRWASTLMVDIRARWSPVLQNLPRIGLALVLLYGGKLVIDGEVTVGTRVEFNAYVVMLQLPFMYLGFLMMLAQRAAASAQRIFEVLDSPPEIVDRPGAFDLVAPVGAVDFVDVSFGYGEGPAVLDGFSLHLAPGETVALVGRTGTGKSTVARLLPRFYDVREGRVLVDGHDVRDLTVESLRAHIGLVLDEPFLFSETIRNNIAYGKPEASMEEVVEAARAANALDFILALPEGFDTVVGERGYTLSGGQRQRIAIARTSSSTRASSSSTTRRARST
ncbi:MAG: ABC transporter ATP-binding protein [Acidimicrobiia bacterium]